MMHRSMLLLSLVLAAASAPARAQGNANVDSVLLAAVIVNGPTLSEHEAGTRCLDLPGGWLREDDQAQAWLCEPQETSELERAGDRRYFWTRYARTAPSQDADGQPDTLREDHVVLFSAPLDGRRLTAEWHARYDLDLWTGVHLQVGPADDGSALVSVLACVNGTAGCAQELLLRRGDGWRVVRQAWVEQLPDSVNGEFWKGTYVNPMTLQGRAPLYGEGDANCCPSRILYVRLRLDDDALVLRDFRTVALDQP